MDKDTKTLIKVVSSFIGAGMLVQLSWKGCDYLAKPIEALLVDQNKDGIKEILIKSKVDEEIYYPLKGIYEGKQIYRPLKHKSRLERESNEVKVYYTTRDKPYELKISEGN